MYEKLKNKTVIIQWRFGGDTLTGWAEFTSSGNDRCNSLREIIASQNLQPALITETSDKNKEISSMCV